MGLLGAVFGKKPDYYVFITHNGEKYLDDYGHTTAEEDELEFALNESPEDRRNNIEDAVRVYRDSFSKDSNYSSEKIKEASAKLDDDIKAEVEAAALEIENMWDEYEIKFGHRGPACSEQEAKFRDPVIKTTTVRVFRAMDEQLKRLALPESRKPQSWDTHYQGGNVDLEPASWQRE